MSTVNPSPDQEGLMDLLESTEEVDLGELCDLPSDPGLDAQRDEYRKKVLGELITVTPEEEWADDPFAVAWTKIRSAFLSGKDAFSIKAYARTLSEGAWLEMAQKMAPKDVKVTGEVGLRHLLDELGPIDKEKYRIRQVEDVEFSEVK